MRKKHHPLEELAEHYKMLEEEAKLTKDLAECCKPHTTDCPKCKGPAVNKKNPGIYQCLKCGHKFEGADSHV